VIDINKLLPGDRVMVTEQVGSRPEDTVYFIFEYVSNEKTDKHPQFLIVEKTFSIRDTGGFVSTGKVIGLSQNYFNGIFKDYDFFEAILETKKKVRRGW
jgi:hypothetical protein